MSLWEISFRAQYDYPFIQMSGRHPGLPISMWCLFNRELLQVPTADPQVLASIEKEITKAGRVLGRGAGGRGARVFMLQKGTGDDLDSPADVGDKRDFVDAPPAGCQDGGGHLPGGGLAQA